MDTQKQQSSKPDFTRTQTVPKGRFSVLKIVVISFVVLFLLCMSCFVSIILFNQYQDRYYRSKIDVINQRVIDQTE